MHFVHSNVGWGYQIHILIVAVFSGFTSWLRFICIFEVLKCCLSFRATIIYHIDFLLQAVDIKLLGSLNRDDLKKICGDNFPEWISFPVFEQVGLFTYLGTLLIFSSNEVIDETFGNPFSVEYVGFLFLGYGEWFNYANTGMLMEEINSLFIFSKSCNCNRLCNF